MVVQDAPVGLRKNKTGRVEEKKKRIGLRTFWVGSGLVWVGSGKKHFGNKKKENILENNKGRVWTTETYEERKIVWSFLGYEAWKMFQKNRVSGRDIRHNDKTNKKTWRNEKNKTWRDVRKKKRDVTWHDEKIKCNMILTPFAM